MKAKTQLSHTLEIAQNKIAYDTACKKVLSNKNILAWILKECVVEYNNFPITTIRDKYIEGIPIISKIPVHANEMLTSFSDREGELIIGDDTADKSLTDETSLFDIRFTGIVPATSTEKNNSKFLTLFLNIEGQKNPSPGYPLTKRGIYYCCRMISAQYGTVFTKSQYQKINKVYSIWICPYSNSTPKKKINTINKYFIKEKYLVGDTKEKKRNYDLMTLIMIYLGDAKQHPTDNAILKLLNTIFSKELPPNTKIQILEDDFSIPSKIELKGEIDEMCNFSDIIFEDAINEGLALGKSQGMAQGIAQGMAQGMAQGITVTNILCSKLIELERFDDLKRSTTDSRYQQQLFEEFGLDYKPQTNKKD